MARPLPWWIAPFVGTILMLVGLFAALLIVSVPVKRAIGRALGEALDAGLDQVLGAWVPADRAPDLDIAPGTAGFVETLSMAGRQLHFHDREKDRTRIAVDTWINGEKARIVVGEYDGAPSRQLMPDLVRFVEPPLPMLVVSVGGPADVRWTDGGLSPRPNRADAAGALNLLVLPGKVTLWTGDGPHHDIEVKPRETVWCTLGAGGLVVDRRR